MSDDRVSRRDLLRGRLFGRAGPTPDGTGRSARTEPDPDAARRHALFPVLRPPGAVEEGLFLDRCTRCNACIEACPHEAIRHAPARLRQAAGTPMIDPILAPCRMCEDLPCIGACPEAALVPMPAIRMGTASIRPWDCLAHQGGMCSACWEQCPVPGAIEVTNGRPRVVEDRCTGCGVCQHVCPAPANAVMLLPAERRPAPCAPPEGGCDDGS